MALNSMRTWVLGTVLVALLIAAGLWFLLLSPTLDQAASVRDQAATITSANEVRTVGLDKLKKDAANLPTMRADLATLEAAIPGSAQVPDFLRQLQAVAAAHSVSIGAVQVETPTVVKASSPAASSTPTPSPSASASTSASTSSGGTSGLVAIPISITASGDRASLDAFLSDVQTQLARLVLVSQVTETRSQDQTGPPYTDQLGGNLYVLPQAAAPVASTDTATGTATDAPTPTPTP
jgi:Tfp pilus assembly protein PilO